MYNQNKAMMEQIQLYQAKKTKHWLFFLNKKKINLNIFTLAKK